MKYRTDKDRIEIFKDTMHDKNSPDKKKQYDLIYFDTDYLTTILGIIIFQDEKQIRSALIGSDGGATGVSKDTVIIENDRLVVCCSNSVFCLALPTLGLYWRTQADEASCFYIFKYKDSYIVHGELNISRIDNNGNILWQQGGADIFTTPEGKDDFIITDHNIIATDWNGRKYKFDFDGNILS